MAKGYIWFHLALLILLVALAGCGPTAFQVEIVPAHQQLKETEIQRDKGLFTFAKIAVIDVDGLLINKRKHGWMQEGDNPVSLFVEKLDKPQRGFSFLYLITRLTISRVIDGLPTLPRLPEPSYFSAMSLLYQRITVLGVNNSVHCSRIFRLSLLALAATLIR